MSSTTLTPTANLSDGKAKTAGTTIPVLSDGAVQSANFDVRVGCDRQGQTFVAQQYTTYPFRLSRTFRLDEGGDRRAYLYLMNSAPGIFGGDRLTLNLTVAPNSNLYLTDQAATKVHKMLDSTVAHLDWHITVGAAANLEFVPEPLILYADAQLHQSTTITLEASSSLFLSEIIVPGRLARSEYYRFVEYRNRLHVRSTAGNLLFRDNMHLLGQSNPFKDSIFFTKYPLIANIYMVLPTVNLNQFSQLLTENLALKLPNLLIGISQLPNCNGLLIKVMGDRVETIQSYIYRVLSSVRKVHGDLDLPHVPK